jgi:preprotein translocase subunit SecE
VARDRKRAKQRRERQARAGGQGRRADAATAPAREREPDALPGRNGADGELEEHRTELDEVHEHEPPERASGDVDLIDAQLALGRPELAREGDSGPSAIDDPHDLPELADEEAFEELEDEVDETEAGFEGREQDEEDKRRRAARRRAAAVAAAQQREQREGNRFVNFLRGSWRELQRVQWPDRRQVAQATAVVVGFVIVAGAFLGLMDLLAGKIVDFLV